MFSRLAPGVEVVVLPAVHGGHAELAVRTADGEFLRVCTGEVSATELLDRLMGSTSAGSPDVERLAEAFDRAGYLTRGPVEAHWPEGRREVWLLGAEELTTPLTGLLRAAGARPRLAEPEELRLGAPAAVVWCLNSPAGQEVWRAADTLPQRGVAWARCHREGWQLWIEPLSVEPGDTTSAQLRARRLAATPAHRELAEYWGESRHQGHPVPLTPAAASVAAGLLADDLSAWATDAPPQAHGLPSRRRLRCLDLRHLSLSEHPVLPVPPVAARSAAI